MIIQIYNNIWLKKCAGESSQPHKTIIQQPLEGLSEIYTKWKNCRNVEVAVAVENRELELDGDS